MAIMHERIKELRTQKGLTLSQVSEFLGVTEATAQRYETGKGIKTVPYEVIEKYANLFKCPPQYILGWEKAVEDDPIKEANRLADIFLNEELKLMIDDYKKLDSSRQAQVRDYIRFLLSQM